MQKVLGLCGLHSEDMSPWEFAREMDKLTGVETPDTDDTETAAERWLKAIEEKRDGT